MFKDTKAFVDQLADATTGSIQSFDQTVKDNPELIVPLAVVHVIPIALSIAGVVVLLRGHEQIIIEKEKTRRVRMRFMMKHHGHHGEMPPFGPHPLMAHVVAHHDHHHAHHQHHGKPADID